MPPAAVPWMEAHHRQAVAVAWVLLACYIAPVFLGAVALVGSDWMKEDSWAVEWFAAFLQNSDNTLNEFHKVLLPVMTSITVITFSGRPTAQLFYLAAFVLLLFLLTVFVSVSFDVTSIAEGLTGLNASLEPSLAKLFLGRMQESLMSFLMLLLGVGVVNQQTAKKE